MVQDTDDAMDADGANTEVAAEARAQDLRAAIAPDMAYNQALSSARKRAKLRQAGARSAVKTRVALLGNSTTSQLSTLLDLFLFALNIDAEIYEAPYGLMRQEVLDPDSGLYQFAPQFVFIASTRRDVGAAPRAGDSHEAVEAMAEAAGAEWEALWRMLRDRLDCQIIQNNFDAPPWRAFGNLDRSQPGAPGDFIARVNRQLAARAPAWVSIFDLDGLAGAVGRWNWGDERFFHLAKLPCAPEHLPPYAHGVAALINARLGRSRKCLVLDLDNTLWGGVVGDDGLSGINIGQGDAVGEAFVAFQRYAKSLAERGVILAVCSKNEDANAREPFEKRSEMVLRLEDISCFVANWDDKAANLRRIAAELNIGMDSLVFVDDNPAERALVRQLAPEVAVPELPLDPADYIKAVDQHLYFETVSISSEDVKRTEYYRANAAREQIASTVADLDEYLRSLEMKAWVGPIGDLELERSVQLIGKSNQFNLTTQRYSAGEIETMRADPKWATRVIKLADRFGDNGLITVLLAHEDGDALAIDTWLMSCRVLKRGVERLLLNSVVAEARARGLSRVTGEYIPTAKNILVKDHYSGLGFTSTRVDEDGRTAWALDIGPDWSPLQHFISEE